MIMEGNILRGRPTGRKAHIPGLIITIVLLLIAMEFIGLLVVTKLVPVYLIFAGNRNFDLCFAYMSSDR